MSMKKAIAAGMLSVTLVATSAQAGGFAEPEVLDAEIILDDTAAATAGNVWVPLLLLALIAAAVATSGGGSTPAPIPAVIGGGFGPA